MGQNSIDITTGERTNDLKLGFICQGRDEVRIGSDCPR